MNINKPLAERMRPKSLKDFKGQEHLTSEGKILRQIIEQKIATSIIFWGPPGVGKTTLGRLIADSSDLPFFALSAIESGVKEVRNVIDIARKSGKVLLFIDEIHRFNKTQQDALLGAVEQGIIVLIGATTENPSFEVINALLSRCQIFVLKDFSENDLKAIVTNALEKDEWLKEKNLTIKEWDALIRFSGGDGRKILNVLELVAVAMDGNVITNNLVSQIIQNRIAEYDKSGEMHYDTISAFIKSIRGSDPNAAVYYLARMLDGGEDVKFIARRLIILASEDIGNANPNVLLLATSAFQAVSMIGMPESRIILAQISTYLASSPKSNAAYLAIDNALNTVRKTGNLSIPLSIRNAPTNLMKNLNYGSDYQYAHDFQNHFVNMEFLPNEIIGSSFYQPSDQGNEGKLKAYLSEIWQGKYKF